MSAYEEKTPSLEWKPLPDDLTTSLPFEATLAVVDDEGQPLTELREQVSVSAITSKVCLAEGFEKESMGLWSPAFLPGHYEHGFDTEVCAPDGSTSSLYLKGGNDSNFGMTLRLPAPAAGRRSRRARSPRTPSRRTRRPSTARSSRSPSRSTCAPTTAAPTPATSSSASRTR